MESLTKLFNKFLLSFFIYMVELKKEVMVWNEKQKKRVNQKLNTYSL